MYTSNNEQTNDFNEDIHNPSEVLKLFKESS